MPVIETSNLTKYYGKSRGIVDINLSIEQGEFFGFIGPNGAGKSTFIRTLLGLITPTSGKANVLEKQLSESSQYLKQIGYMPSEAMFYNGMRVDEVITYSAKLRGIDCRLEAKELCNRLELDVSKRIEELSLGNRKKVSIVCALQHKPLLYILDEPTSGLDPLIQKVFFELLQERNRNGATIFFSSHVLPEVQNNCTRAGIIREGRLIALDTIDNLSKTNAKHIMLQGTSQLPHIPGTKLIAQSDHSIHFLYQGDIKALLAVINSLPITDMTITDPDLEEIFLHYYEGVNL